MDNQRIASVFQEIGDMLEIQGANRFRVLAYQKAALTLSEMGQELHDIWQEDPKKLEDIPGIGKDLAAKIEEMLKTGKCQYHTEMASKFPKGLLDMLRVRGVGPKKVKLFFGELQIDSVEKLREAAKAGRLRALPGMGPKSETEILGALEEFDKHSERMMLSDALHQVSLLVAYLKKHCKEVEKIEYAGSLRRMKETIGDLDILVQSQHPEKVTACFTRYPHCQKVIASGETKTSIILDVGIQVDLRVVPEKSFGAALHYFTGSKEHNVALRDHAKKRGYKVNEYGIFKGEKYVAGRTEEEMYDFFKMDYVPPVLRENRGEIEAAEKGRLPKLVQHKDLRGDLHVHSHWSDGVDEIEVLAKAYRDAGFEYMALTDHSPAVTVAHGLTPERYKMQWDEIDAVNAEFGKDSGRQKRAGGGGKSSGGPHSAAGAFTILKGTECDILPDGSLDLPDSVLKKMDIVVASVHSRFNMPEKQMTARVLKALKNPYVTQLGHPSGRLINEREPYAIDMPRVIAACAEAGVALEIDGQPARLDLFDYYAKMAVEKGAMLTLDSDAHSIAQMKFLHYAVAVAQRGWVEKRHVLNTMKLADLKNWVEKRRG